MRKKIIFLVLSFGLFLISTPSYGIDNSGFVSPFFDTYSRNMFGITQLNTPVESALFNPALQSSGNAYAMETILFKGDVSGQLLGDSFSNYTHFGQGNIGWLVGISGALSPHFFYTLAGYTPRTIEYRLSTSIAYMSDPSDPDSYEISLYQTEKLLQHAIVGSLGFRLNAVFSLGTSVTYHHFSDSTHGWGGFPHTGNTAFDAWSTQFGVAITPIEEVEIGASYTPKTNVSLTDSLNSNFLMPSEWNVSSKIKFLKSLSMVITVIDRQYDQVDSTLYKQGVFGTAVVFWTPTSFLSTRAGVEWSNNYINSPVNFFGDLYTLNLPSREQKSILLGITSTLGAWKIDMAVKTADILFDNPVGGTWTTLSLQTSL